MTDDDNDDYARENHLVIRRFVNFFPDGIRSAPVETGHINESDNFLKVAGFHQSIFHSHDL